MIRNDRKGTQGMRKGKKEEGKMKKLSIAALLLIALTTGAVAHEGSIGMFTDLTGTGSKPGLSKPRLLFTLITLVPASISPGPLLPMTRKIRKLLMIPANMFSLSPLANII